MEKKLTSIDLHRMLASGAKLAADSAQVQVEVLRGVVNQQAAEIAYLKAQISMSEAAKQAADRQKMANAAQQTTRDAHSKLAEEIGRTYKVDWKDSSFCPLTGDIRPLEAASTMGDKA